MTPDPRSQQDSSAQTVTPAPRGVQSPLTLVMTIKSEQSHRELVALLTRMQSAPPDKNPIWMALNKLQTVHFARFVFLENNTKLAVITTYDGSFDDYINEFIDEIGDVFNALLAHMKDAPPLPVQKNRQAVPRLRPHQRPAGHRAVLQRLSDGDGARHPGGARTGLIPHRARTAERHDPDVIPPAARHPGPRHADVRDAAAAGVRPEGRERARRCQVPGVARGRRRDDDLARDGGGLGHEAWTPASTSDSRTHGLAGDAASGGIARYLS